MEYTRRRSQETTSTTFRNDWHNNWNDDGGKVDGGGEPPAFEIRYSYRTRPNVPEPITQSRAFCEKLLELNRTYTRQDIDNISERVDRDVWKYRGGWYTNPETHVTTPYCRHEWVQQIAIKRPAVDTTQPEEPLIQVGTVTIKTIAEGKELAKQIIEETFGTKAKIEVSSKISKESFEKRLN